MAEDNRTVKRAPTFIIAFLCLIVCCAVISFIGPRGRRGEMEKQVIPVISIVRRLQALGLKAVGFSPKSNHFFIQRKDNKVEVFSPTGVKQWSAQLPDSAAATLSADGDYIMAFSERNPADSKLTFIDSSGRAIWNTAVDGAIWCADSCEGDRAARFLVGTGRGCVYVIDVGARTRRFRRWRMPGAVVSLGVDRHGDDVISASWQRSALKFASLRGRGIWESEAEPAGLHEVRPLAASDRVLVEFTPVDARQDGAFQVLDGAGQQVFGGVLSVDEGTRVYPSPGGRFVCLGVSKLIMHKGKSMRENHALLMDDTGRVLWEKGSPFFQAVPLAVTKSGYAIVSDGKTSIFLVSPEGEMRPSQKVPSPVRGCVASRDGSRLLLKCCDGTLVLLNVAG